MSVSDVNFSVLPSVLQDLVLDFAFNLPKTDVLESLDVILSIIDMDLPQRVDLELALQQIPSESSV